MIKVIAADMDGTLLNDQHHLEEKTVEAILRAQKAGILFIVATGRNYMQAMEEFKDTPIRCDFIVGSGAEIRTRDGQIKHSISMDIEDCRMVYQTLTETSLMPQFGTNNYEYIVGDEEKNEAYLIRQMKDFFLSETMSDEEIKKSELYQRIRMNRKSVPDFETLTQIDSPIYKISTHSTDTDLLKEVQNRLKQNTQLAVASSFPTNIEITDIHAQKGLVLAEYIQNLGYKMEEVMVLGDSMNDYSMLSMKFGATVAMENSMEEIKQVAEYITKSNQEYGVAYAIDKVLES